MGHWSFKCTKSDVGSLRAIGSVSAAATPRRAKLHDVLMGYEGTPGDATWIYQLIRTTAVGTATSETPVADDPGDAALAGGEAMVARTVFTADPTFSGVALMAFPLNQRATMRWQAVPGRELIVPAVNLNGIALALAVATPTVTFGGSMSYEEL